MELVGAAATEEVEGVGEFWDPQSNNILYFIPPISTLNITLMPLPLPLPPPSHPQEESCIQKEWSQIFFRRAPSPPPIGHA